MAWTRLDAHISLLELAWNDGGLLDAVLTPLGSAIRQAEERIRDAQSRASPEDVDFFVDDECEIIENLLGTAFIACQTQITAVVSGGIKLADHCKDQGIVFAAYTNQDSLLAIGGNSLSSLPVEPARFMNAVANYFKHRDEWLETDWTRLPAQSQRTAGVIQRGGLKSGSTGNLRAAARALGNSGLSSTNIFADIIQQWAAQVLAVTKQELGLP